MYFFKPKIRVVFVCTENICRSPLAEVVLRHHVQRLGMARQIKVSSAGTRCFQPGARPDQRARRVVAASGLKLGSIRARRVTERLLVESDFVFAMDRAHLKSLLELCPHEHRHKIRLLLSYLPQAESREVPDPYYGNYHGFEQVFKLIESAVADLVSRKFWNLKLQEEA